MQWLQSQGLLYWAREFEALRRTRHIEIDGESLVLLDEPMLEEDFPTSKSFARKHFMRRVEAMCLVREVCMRFITLIVVRFRNQRSVMSMARAQSQEIVLYVVEVFVKWYFVRGLAYMVCMWFSEYYFRKWLLCVTRQ